MTASACPKCGVEAFELTEDTGHVQRFKCYACGHEEAVLVHYLSEEEKTAALEPERSTVAYLVWRKGRPTAAEIAGARRVAPVLQDKALSELSALFKEASRFRLGVFFQWEINQMQDRAKKLNMYIESEPLPRPSDFSK